MTTLPKYLMDALDQFQAAARGVGGFHATEGYGHSYKAITGEDGLAEREAAEESARAALEAAISRAIGVEKSLEVLGAPTHVHNWVILPGTGYKRQVCVGNLPDNPACGEERDTPLLAQAEAEAWAHFDTTRVCGKALETGGNCGRGHGHPPPCKRVE